jgi:hypothetical protein
MTKTKEKLTSSVRKAKTTQQSKPENAISEQPPADEKNKENYDVKKAVVKKSTVSKGSTPEHSDELFPERVWPD